MNHPIGRARRLYRDPSHIRHITAMECVVNDVRFTSFGSPAPREPEVPFMREDISTCRTPGKVISQIGRVIAICLGLGLLAHVLVAPVGG
jgi:hypothetical protein